MILIFLLILNVVDLATGVIKAKYIDNNFQSKLLRVGTLQKTLQAIVVAMAYIPTNIEALKIMQDAILGSGLIFIVAELTSLKENLFKTKGNE